MAAASNLVELNRARVRKTYQRRQAGLRCMTVEFNEIKLPMKLVEAGLLDPSEADDLDAIAEATSRLLKIFSMENAE